MHAIIHELARSCEKEKDEIPVTSGLIQSYLKASYASRLRPHTLAPQKRAAYTSKLACTYEKRDAAVT